MLQLFQIRGRARQGRRREGREVDEKGNRKQGQAIILLHKNISTKLEGKREGTRSPRPGRRRSDDRVTGVNQYSKRHCTGLEERRS